MALPWPKTPLTKLGLVHPIIQAPMGGGVDTPALVAAASEAGCLGSLGAGYLSGHDIEHAIADIRRRTHKPFGVNLFLPETVTAQPQALEAMNALLDPYRKELGLPPSPPVGGFWQPFDAQIEAVLQTKPPLVSFTFGCPSAGLVARLRGEGVQVAGTATCVREALALEAIGVDLIIVQGAEAGGHRGSFPSTEHDPMVGTMALVPQVVDRVRVPVVAAGGIMDGRGIVAAFALGAAGVQMGTAFMVAAEAGTSPVHRASILGSDDESTAVTSAFTGKRVRGIRNRFMRELEAHAGQALPYPIQHALTRDIRQAAVKAGRADLAAMWAGQGAGLAHEDKVQALVDGWVEEARAVLQRLGAG